MVRMLSKFLILSILLLLTGCWDYKDINERSIALSVGLDSIDGQVQFTGEIAKLTSPTGSDNERAESRDIYTMLAFGKDFEEARIHYDSIIPHPVFLGATQIVVFSENYAKQGIEPYLNRINKIYDYRKTLIPVVSKVPPRQLFGFKQEKSTSVGFLIEDIVNNLNDKKMTVYSNFGQILSTIELDGVGYLMPYIGIQNNNIGYLGLAVMKDSKLVGIVDYEDTDGLIYALADKPILTESLFSADNEENKISLRTSVKNRRVKTEYKNGKVIFNMDLLVAGEVRYQYFLSPITNQQHRHLEKMVSKKLTTDITKIFERSQKEFKCDIFQFAKNFRAEHPEIYKELNWEEAYINADLNINVKTEIINLGLTDPNA